MNWVDGLILGILLYNVLTGMFKGFVRSVAGLLALVLSTIAAGRFGNETALLLGFSPKGDAFAPIIGSAVAGLVVYLAVSIAGFLVARTIRGGGLRKGDRWAGAILGVFVGLLTVLVPLAFVDDAPVLKKSAGLSIPKEFQAVQEINGLEESRQKVVQEVAATRARSVFWQLLTPLEPPAVALTRLCIGWQAPQPGGATKAMPDIPPALKGLLPPSGGVPVTIPAPNRRHTPGMPAPKPGKPQPSEAPE